MNRLERLEEQLPDVEDEIPVAILRGDLKQLLAVVRAAQDAVSESRTGFITHELEQALEALEKE